MKIDDLTVGEKLDLIDELWESIRKHPEQLELSEEHKRILDERLRAYELDGDPGDSWEVVKERIQNKM